MQYSNRSYNRVYSGKLFIRNVSRIITHFFVFLVCSVTDWRLSTYFKPSLSTNARHKGEDAMRAASLLGMSHKETFFIIIDIFTEGKLQHVNHKPIFCNLFTQHNISENLYSTLSIFTGEKGGFLHQRPPHTFSEVLAVNITGVSALFSICIHSNRVVCLCKSLQQLLLWLRLQMYFICPSKRLLNYSATFV